MSILSMPHPVAPLPRHRLASAPADVRRISSQSLLEGARELVIQHQGGEYHLRLTRNDKLILTK
ncbi:hypothetical protein ASG87_08475 [Frateuria sp. Soil773]|nr:hypothetical protein ASG87_08475 [Frateuria sp. Soil773]